MWSTTPQRGCVAACSRRSTSDSARSARIVATAPRGPAASTSPTSRRTPRVNPVRLYSTSRNTFTTRAPCLAHARSAVDSSSSITTASFPSEMYTTATHPPAALVALPRAAAEDVDIRILARPRIARVASALAAMRLRGRHTRPKKCESVTCRSVLKEDFGVSNLSWSSLKLPWYSYTSYKPTSHMARCTCASSTTPCSAALCTARPFAVNVFATQVSPSSNASS